MNTTANKVINGVDTEALVNTIQAIRENPELGRFQFRAKNRAVEGGLNRSEIKEFHGAGREHRLDKEPFVLENDEPSVLLSDDQAPNPVEHVIHGLLGCMTTSTLYHAASRGIEIESIRSEVEGDLDVRGMLGLDPSTRCGYQELRVKLRIKTKGPKETVGELYRYSPVVDTLARPVPIKVQVEFED